MKRFWGALIKFLGDVLRALAASSPAPSPPDSSQGGSDAPPPSEPSGPGEPFGHDEVRWVSCPNPLVFPRTATLSNVSVVLPQVCWGYAAWPSNWPKHGAKNVDANMVVIAKIDGEWWGSPWESLDGFRFNEKGACRDLEALTKNTGEGPMGQAEGPFVHWRPKSGEECYMLLTTFIRHHQVSPGPTERSNIVKVVWP